MKSLFLKKLKILFEGKLKLFRKLKFVFSI